MKNFRVIETSTGNVSNIPEDLLSDKFEVIAEVDEDGNTPAEVTAFAADALAQQQRKTDSINKY